MEKGSKGRVKDGGMKCDQVRVGAQLADGMIPTLPTERIRKWRLLCVQLFEDEVSAVPATRSSNLPIIRSRCPFIFRRRGCECQGMKDGLTLTKLLKDWQQRGLCMRKDQISIHN